MDEKSQIQALERTQPVRRVWLDRPEQRTHDDVRHTTTTLFAALEVATGQVLDQCQPRHRHQEFLAFLIAAIGRFCVAWNHHCQPFAWTKPANEILAKLNRQPLQPRTPGHLKAQVRS